MPCALCQTCQTTAPYSHLLHKGVAGGGVHCGGQAQVGGEGQRLGNRGLWGGGKWRRGHRISAGREGSGGQKADGATVVTAPRTSHLRDVDVRLLHVCRAGRRLSGGYPHELQQQQQTLYTACPVHAGWTRADQPPTTPALASRAHCASQPMMRANVRSSLGKPLTRMSPVMRPSVFLRGGKEWGRDAEPEALLSCCWRGKHCLVGLTRRAPSALLCAEMASGGLTCPPARPSASA